MYNICMAVIPLTKGFTTIIDDADYELVTRYKWHAVVHTYKNGKQNVRAFARIWNKEKKVYKNWGLTRWIMRPEKGYVVDHINGDLLDNRRQNLRICTQSENIHNTVGRYKNKSSKYRGVCFDNSRGTWLATICKTTDGKKYQKNLGRFLTEEEAALAYNKAAIELFNSPWLLNVITPDI